MPTSTTDPTTSRPPQDTAAGGLLRGLLSRRLTGWPAAALVGAAFFVAMLGTTLPTPLYPTYATDLGFGELVTTVVFATYAVGVLAGLLLFGHWSDQLGRRPMLLAALGLSSLSAAVFLLPEAMGWLYAGRLLSGVSAGIMTGTATATVVDLAPKEQQGRASLVAAAVNMAGLGSGPLLAGVLVEHAPLPTRLAFLVDLGLVAVGVLLVLAVTESVRREPGQGRSGLAPRGLHVPAEARSSFVRAAIVFFAGFSVMGLFTAVTPAFLGDVLGERSTTLVGVVVAVLFAGSVLGQLLVSAVGLDRALRLGCTLLVVGMALIGGSLAAGSLALLVVGAVVAGTGQGMSFRSGLAGVSSASPEEVRGEVTSTLFVTAYLGISLPVVGVGALATAAGLVTAGVTFSVVVALLAVVALVLLARRPSDA